MKANKRNTQRGIIGMVSLWFIALIVMAMILKYMSFGGWPTPGDLPIPGLVPSL